MREILFRAKDTDGEWRYGALIPQGARAVIAIHDKACTYDFYDVFPKTVGQYTGLTDKNGRKIFEGDIVEGHCHSAWSHNLRRCEIAYNRDSFEARHYVMQGGNERYYTYRVLFSKDVKVIGNIYDNPEMLLQE